MPFEGLTPEQVMQKNFKDLKKSISDLHRRLKKVEDVVFKGTEPITTVDYKADDKTSISEKPEIEEKETVSITTTNDIDEKFDIKKENMDIIQSEEKEEPIVTEKKKKKQKKDTGEKQ